MKNTINFNAKIIRNSADQGTISDMERLGLKVLHDYIIYAAYDVNQPQEIREYALQQLATLPELKLD